MADTMGAVNVGSSGGGGTVAGIPGKYLLLGLGGLGLAFILLKSQGSSAAPPSGDVQPTGSLSAMLSSLQGSQAQQYGDLTKRFSDTSDAISGLSTHLDTQAAALGDQVAATGAQIGSQVTAANAAIGSGFATTNAQIAAGATANATAFNNLGIGQSQIERQAWANFLNLMALGGSPLNGDVTGPFYFDSSIGNPKQAM